MDAKELAEIRRQAAADGFDCESGVSTTINALLDEIDHLRDLLAVAEPIVAKATAPAKAEAVTSNEAVRLMDTRELMGELLGDMRNYTHTLLASKEVQSDFNGFVHRLDILARKLSKVQVLDSAAIIIGPSQMRDMWEARSAAANECLTERRKQEELFKTGLVIESKNAAERGTYQGGIWEGLTRALNIIQSK